MSPPSFPPPKDPERQQRMRLHRVAMASVTYAIGLVPLGLAAAWGLMAWSVLALVAGLFVVINASVWAMFLSGLNRRFADPSMTLWQLLVGASAIACVAAGGPAMLVIAVPFYCVLFVFAMLRLQARALAGLVVFILLTFGVALRVRAHRYGAALDWRVEALSAVQVAVNAAWLAVAASYISALRLRLRESIVRNEELALRDPLTGLWNRRKLDLLLEAEISRAGRHGGRFCVALADLDHFKAINDELGHEAGDDVLRQAALQMQACLRAVDQIGRYGGEEFLMLLPESTLEQARVCVERLRAGLASPYRSSAAGPTVTVSVGVVAWQPGETPNRLVARADRALYRAKALGRNRIEVEAGGAESPGRQDAGGEVVSALPASR